jgi:hypothetical protein
MTLFAFKCLYPTGEAQHILHFLVLYSCRNSCLCIRLYSLSSLLYQS